MKAKDLNLAILTFSLLATENLQNHFFFEFLIVNFASKKKGLRVLCL